MNGYTHLVTTTAPIPGRRRFRLGLVGALILVHLALYVGYQGWERVKASKEYEAALARYDAAGGPSNSVRMKPVLPSSATDGTGLYLKALELEPSDYVELRPETLAKESEESSAFVEIDRDPTDEEWKEIEKLVHEAAPRIELLIEAAKTANVIYPAHYEQGWAMLLPHIRAVIKAGRLVYWDIRIRRKAGTAEGTWPRIDAIFGLADSLASEPLMVSQLVRIVLLEIGLSSLEETLGSSDPPEEWRKKLEARLDPEGIREGMRRCSIFELAMMQDTVTRYIRGEPTSTQLDRDVIGFTKWMAMPKIWKGAARCFDRLGRIRAAVDLPAAGAIPEFETILREFDKDPFAFGFLLAAYGRSWRRSSSVAVRVTLAKEAMRLRHLFGDPAKAPESISEVGNDPLFGRPWTYRRTEKGFSLEMSATADELESPWEIRKPMFLRIEDPRAGR